MSGPSESTERLREKCLAQKKKMGRENHSRTTKNPPGRPKGGNLAAKEWNEFVESSAFSDTLDSVREIVKDTDHKFWPYALKFVGDRGFNASHFEAEKNPTPAGLTINVTGSVNVSDTIEADYQEVEGDS